MAPPAAWPPSHASTSAAACGTTSPSTTVEPLTSTTTTFGFVAATHCRVVSWLAGRFMWVRSKPSDSSAAGSPRIMTTVSACGGCGDGFGAQGIVVAGVADRRSRPRTVTSANVTVSSSRTDSTLVGTTWELPAPW